MEENKRSGYGRSTDIGDIAKKDFQAIAQLRASLQQRIEQLAALSEVSWELTQTLDKVLSNIAEKAAHLLNADSSSIRLLDEQGRLNLVEGYGLSEGFKKGVPLKVGEGVIGLVVKERRPIAVEDVTKDPRIIYKEEGAREGIVSLLAVPLSVKGKAIGSLCVYSKRPTVYTEDESFLLGVLADQAAVAVENARLFASKQHQVKELTTVHQASQTITSSLSIDEVIEKVISLAGTVVNSEYTSIILVDKDGNFGPSYENFQGIPPLHLRMRPHGITMRIIQRKEPIVIDEVLDNGETNFALISAGIKSYAGVPIMVKGRIIGVLFVHSTRLNAFGRYVDLLTTFANQVAIALENARLYQEVLYLKKFNERVVANTPSYLLALDEDFNVLSASRKFCNDWGVAEEMVKGKNIRDLFPFPFLQETGLLELVQEIIKNGGYGELKGLRYPSADREDRILNVRVMGLRIEKEAILNIEDLTERERSERKTREAKEYLKNLVKGSVDAIVSTDKEGNITLFSHGAERMLGYKAEEIIGKSVVTLYENREKAKEVMKEMYKGEGEVVGYEVRFKSKSGELIPVLMSALQLKDEEGKVVGTVGYSKDIRQRLRLENEVREYAKQLDEKTRELKDLMHSISHDLKVPLISIHGFCSGLAGEFADRLGDEGKFYVDRIQENAERMSGMIEALLRLFRVTEKPEEPHEVNLSELIESIRSEMGFRLDQQGVELVVGGNLPTIACDEERMAQVFRNLIDNAVKAVEKAKDPRVEVSCEDLEDSWLFSISDNGIGIPQEQQERIFEPFYQIPARKASGVGIGLSVVKRVVELQGGRVWAESKPGQGSTFYFTFPKSGGGGQLRERTLDGLNMVRPALTGL